MNCNVSSSEPNRTILRFSTASFLLLLAWFGIVVCRAPRELDKYIAHA